MKLKLEKLFDQNDQPKELKREEMIKLTGGYSYTYTKCSNTNGKGDCTDGSYD